MAAAVTACATAAEPVDLVGRNGQFTVKDGNAVEQVNPTSLKLPREQTATAPRAVITDTTSDAAETAAPPSKKPAAPPKAAPAPQEETPEEKAKRAADVETLRQMRKQGGAYFYTEDNKPIPFDEVDRRIATGEVEGMKAIGLHLQEWTPQTKAKPQAPVESDEIATQDDRTVSAPSAPKKY